MQDEIADYWCCNKAGEGEDVGESVDVFVRSKLFEGVEYWFLRC